MPHKTFEDETFTLKNLNIKVNSLTETDPYVDRVVLTPEEEAVDEISYSANKKVEKSTTKKHPVTGTEFEASSEETEDEKMSEIPEKLVKIQALINDGRTPVVNTNIGRYTSDDGSNTSFYITEDQIEEMEVVMEDEEESEESGNEDTDESSSEDQDVEKQNGSADSDEGNDEEEESSTESSEDDLDSQQRSALSEYLTANSVEEVKEYIDDILDDEKLEEYGGAETFLEAVHEAESEGKDRKTVLEYVERQDGFEATEDSEEDEEEGEEENSEEDDEKVIF